MHSAKKFAQTDRHTRKRERENGEVKWAKRKRRALEHLALAELVKIMERRACAA